MYVQTKMVIFPASYVSLPEGNTKISKTMGRLNHHSFQFQLLVTATTSGSSRCSASTSGWPSDQASWGPIFHTQVLSFVQSWKVVELLPSSVWKMYIFLGRLLNYPILTKSIPTNQAMPCKQQYQDSLQPFWRSTLRIPDK